MTASKDLIATSIIEDGVELDGKEYQHVRYNVVEEKILALDKTFDAPEIIIPDSAEE